MLSVKCTTKHLLGSFKLVLKKKCILFCEKLRVVNLKFFTSGMMKILYLKPLQLINTYKAYECKPVSDSA